MEKLTFTNKPFVAVILFARQYLLYNYFLNKYGTTPTFTHNFTNMYEVVNQSRWQFLSSIVYMDPLLIIIYFNWLWN